MVNGLRKRFGVIISWRRLTQDYHRALGGPGGKTYGKATAENLFAGRPRGRATSTSRISRKRRHKVTPALRLKDVSRVRVKPFGHSRWAESPDIILHDALLALPIREADLRLHAFPSDSIQKKVYLLPLLGSACQNIFAQQLSDSRVKNTAAVYNASGGGVSARHKWIADLGHKDDRVSLVWGDFKKNYEARAGPCGWCGAEFQPPRPVPSRRQPHHAVEQRMQMDAYTDEFNRTWIKNCRTIFS